MDEAIRIYNPGKRHDGEYYTGHPTFANRIHYEKPFLEPEPVKEKKASHGFLGMKWGKERKKEKKTTAKHTSQKNSKWKFWLDPKYWKEVVEEQSKRTHELTQKYTPHVIGSNWFFVLVAVAFFVSCGFWAIDIPTEHVAAAYAESVAAEKDAAHQAYLDQQEADRIAAEKSLENLMKTNATAKAKLAYGSRNFIEKYHYSDADFMTLYQCVDNRLQNKMYEGMTIDEIVFQDGQFIASFNTNPVEDYYYNLAMKSERANADRTSRPVGTDYVYTVYTPHGIYLTNDPKSPEYTWWHWSE